MTPFFGFLFTKILTFGFFAFRKVRSFNACDNDIRSKGSRGEVHHSTPVSDFGPRRRSSCFPALLYPPLGPLDCTSSFPGRTLFLGRFTDSRWLSRIMSSVVIACLLEPSSLRPTDFFCFAAMMRPRDSERLPIIVRKQIRRLNTQLK